jgi:hypothetical protein
MRVPALKTTQRRWVLSLLILGGILLISATATLLTFITIELNGNRYPNTTRLANCNSGNSYTYSKVSPISWAANYSECFSTKDNYSAINTWYVNRGWLYDGTTNTFGKMIFHDLPIGYIYFYEQINIDRSTGATTLTLSNGFQLILNDLP